MIFKRNTIIFYFKIFSTLLLSIFADKTLALGNNDFFFFEYGNSQKKKERNSGPTIQVPIELSGNWNLFFSFFSLKIAEN